MVSFTDAQLTIELYSEEGFPEPNLENAHDIHITFKISKHQTLDIDEGFELVDRRFLTLKLNQRETSYFHHKKEITFGVNWLDENNERVYAGDGVIEVKDNVLDEFIGSELDERDN